MYRDVLKFVADRGGAPVTEIQKAFGMAKEMAACLCIELQDAGWLSDLELSPCHHQDPGNSCDKCTGGTCSSAEGQTQETLHLDGGEFKQGCCGMNSPFHVTLQGRAQLDASP